MTIRKVPFRRELGTFSSQQAQIQGQDAARAANDARRRLDDNILVALTSQFTTSSQSLQQTPLKFNVKKGDLWFVEFWGFGHSAGAGGINYALMGPPGSSVGGTLESSTANTAVANWFISSLVALNTTIAACHAGATDTGRPDRLQARVECGSDGLIGIAISTVTAASLSTLDARALLRATRYVKVT